MRAGLSVDTISMLERGGRRAPRASTVNCLATALKLDPARRRAFEAAATGFTEPAAGGEKTAGTTIQAEAGRTQKRPYVTGFGGRFPVAILTLALVSIVLIGVLGAGLLWGLIPLSGSHSASASAPRPYLTGLSASPSSLRVAEGSYTTISFHLDVAAMVTVTIRDTRGTPEKTLVNNVFKPAGNVSRQYYGWNGAAPLPSGRYLVEVTASANGTAFTARTPLTLM
jgi:hypothetical protein